MNKNTLKDYFALCKLKVVGMMLITSWVGMYLATIDHFSWKIFIFGSLGIGLSAASAAVINHLVDRHIDAKMRRTDRRPLATGRLTVMSAFNFACILGMLGLSILYFMVNILTMTLTGLTLFGYAILYSVILKHSTPQNIVIGGLAGAMPPLLGWTSVSNTLSPYALLLVLIIFSWTPPHFWALAIFRKEEYAKAQIPMLPVTHGIHFTKLSIILYTVLLMVISLLPFLTGMSGSLYFVCACILGILFLIQNLRLYQSQDLRIAQQTFGFSIVYLLLLFMALVMDHAYYLVRE